MSSRQYAKEFSRVHHIKRMLFIVKFEFVGFSLPLYVYFLLKKYSKSSHVPLFCKVGQIYLQSRFFAYLCNEIERGIAAAYVCEVQPQGLLKTLLIQHTRRFALHHLHDVAASLFLQVFAKFLQVIIIYNHDLATFEKLRLNRSEKRLPNTR